MREWFLAVTLGLLAGGTAFAVFAGVAGRSSSLIRVQQPTLLPGIQVRLDRAKLGVEATVFLLRSLAVGGLCGLLMSMATGAWLTIPVGLGAGFAIVWARLEDERNKRLNSYHKGLASAADTIVNSWRVRPSMSRALQAVANYGRPGVAGDFDLVCRAVQGGVSLQVALQEVADKRQSPIFDGLATGLIVAERQSGEVSEMLACQARITRRMAVIYEETVDEQRGQRADVRVGIVGPWVVMALLRLATVATGGFGYGTEFFATPVGQLAAAMAAVLTVAAYVHSNRAASQGLVVERVSLERG